MDDEQLLYSLKWMRLLQREGKAHKVPVAELKKHLLDDERNRLEMSLYEFVQAAWHIIEPAVVFIPSWHIEAICEHLEAVTRGELRRLVINVPPRSSKSSVVSTLWPAWVWTRKPSHQWLCISHSERLATRDTRKMRLVVRDDWYYSRWPISFASDQNLKSYFQNDSQGYRISAGMTAAITGHGADTIVLDDAQDRDAAFSEQKRAVAIEEYREKLSTRLNDPSKGAIVAIGQRLHEDDLFAYLIDNGFDRLTLPMEYESDHPYKTTTWYVDPRKDGDLLCPVRFTSEYVDEQVKILGGHAAAGQFQQRPAPRGGGMFKREWLHLVDECAKDVILTVRYYDCAATKGKNSDYTAGCKLSLDREGIVWVEDVFRGKWTPFERDKALLATTQMDGKDCYVFIEEEGGASGKTAIAYFIRLLRGFTVRPDKVSKSKEMRAQPVASYMEAGNVRILRGEHTSDFIDELLVFPFGKHDDMCDCLSGAYNALMELADKTRISREPILASGEDIEAEHKPFNKEEMEELPDFLRELVEESRADYDTALYNPRKYNRDKL